MPTYQYACTECGARSEAVQRFTDDPLTVCEDCGGRLRKVFSPVGIVFKGSGFYRNDSRDSSGSAAGNGKDRKDANGKDKDGAGKDAAAKDSKAASPASSSSDSGSSSSSSSSDSSGSSSSSSTASSGGSKTSSVPASKAS